MEIFLSYCRLYPCAYALRSPLPRVQLNPLPGVYQTRSGQHYFTPFPVNIRHGSGSFPLESPLRSVPG
jgi:hypothetical protein